MVPCKDYPAGYTEIKNGIAGMKLSYLILFLISVTLAKMSEAQVIGCTDGLALNYNPFALVNDGSCSYEELPVMPVAGFSLSSAIGETSGIIFWNGSLWTHNDNGDINLYALDTLTGEIISAYELTGAVNIDWEEISQDENYIYIGDFGNNSSGNRKDLRILRMSKNSILNGPPLIETVDFSYSGQTDFLGSGPNNTDFDCEAFVVTADSIFLFTKEWISRRTSLFALPNIPGTHTAEFRGTWDVQGLITGSVLLEEKRIIALCGYSSLLEPFIYLLYDYAGTSFFSGNKRKIPVSLPFHQVEAITTENGLKYYITNENFVQSPFVNSPQKLHIIELNIFLENYLGRPAGIIEPDKMGEYPVFPVPAGNFITISSSAGQLPSRYFITNREGKIIQTGRLEGENPVIDISGLTSGLYILKLGRGGSDTYKFIKIKG